MLAEKPARQDTPTRAWHLTVEAEVLEHLGSDPDLGLDALHSAQARNAMQITA